MNEFQEHQRRQRRNAAERAYAVFDFARKHGLPLDVSEQLLGEESYKSEPDSAWSKRRHSGLPPQGGIGWKALGH